MRPIPRFDLGHLIRFPQVTRLLVILAIAVVAGCSSAEERALSHYERGTEYLQAGDPVRAMLEFRNAVKLDERLAPAWYAMATIEEKNENWPVVARTLQTVVELDTAHADARAKLAKLHLAGGDLQKALELVNAASAIRPDDSDIHALMGAVLLRLNDREGARAAAERALSLDRDNPDPYAVLAADAMVDDNTAAALRFVNRGLQAEPHNSGLLLFKLKIHEQDEDFHSIETVMRQLILASPDNKSVRRALVKFLLEQERPQDAETEMRALVAAYPGDATAALELVQFTAAQKGPEAARRELASLIEADPDTVDFHLAMARLDFAQSRAEAAVERLQEIVARGEPIEHVQRARLLLAELMLQDEETEAASELIADVLAADEKNADALALRATLRLRSGDHESATADLRQALDLEPQSVRLRQLMAKVFERQGLIDLADDNYVQAVRLSNYAPAVALEYTNFLLSRGVLARADAILSESLSRVPNNADVLAALGQLRLRQRDWIGAQEVADLLKKLDDRSGLSDQILGAALLGQKQFDRSIELLKGAYSETPQAVRPLYTLVTAYVRAGQAAEAQDFLESVLTASPDNADAHVLLGSLHAMKDEPDAAVAAYRAAIDRRPESPVGYRALASHLISSGNIEKAERVILDGRKQAPGDLGLGLLHAGAQELKSDDEGALAVYEELLETQPDSLILINNVASLIAEHRTDEASLERAYQLALRLRDVDLAHFKDTLGWVHFRRGEFRAAVDYLESAAEGLPEHPLVRYHLGRAYAALERRDDAMAQLTTAAGLVGEDDALGEKIRQALGEVAKSRTLN